jgi:hypothetical protein
MKDVMLVENRSGAGDAACDALRAVGCRVHRCDPPGRDGTALPCRAIDDPDACPLSTGVDVALLVRDQVTPGSSGLEAGLTCAARAGVPIVEDGPHQLEASHGWVTTRSEGNVVDACREAVDASRRPWLDRLERMTRPIVGEEEEVIWSIESTPDRTHLVVHGPQIDAHMRNRVAVRAIDAVRGSPFARPRIDISYRSGVGPKGA